MNEETKFTPGPWESYVGPISMDKGLNPFYRGTVALLKMSGEGADVAVIIPDRGMYYGALNHEANAALIAEAPELYATLVLAFKEIEYDARHDESLKPLYDRIATALKKARGTA